MGRKRTRRAAAKSVHYSDTNENEKVTTEGLTALSKATVLDSKRNGCITRSSSRKISVSLNESAANTGSQCSNLPKNSMNVPYSPSKRCMKQDDTENIQSPSKRQKEERVGPSSSFGENKSRRKLKLKLDIAENDSSEKNPAFEKNRLETSLKKAEKVLQMKQETPSQLREA